MDDPVLQTTDLTFSLVPGLPAQLRNVSLALPPRARCLLVGQNGAGKTTLLELLSGRKMGPAGAIKVAGQDPFRGSSGNQVALVQGGWRGDLDGMGERNAAFQRVWQMLSLPEPSEKEGKIEVELTERLRKLFDMLGLMRLVDRYIGSLSDGERRKVELAKKLKEPKLVVLLDEATMDLDLLSRRAVLEFLAGEDSTVVNVTHVFDGLEDWTTHLVQIHDGEVVRCEAVPPQGPKPWDQSGGLFEMVAAWQRAVTSAEDVVGSPPPAVASADGEEAPAVCVSGLEFAYAEWCPVALRLGALELQRGCRCAVVGPNGAGKSSLLSILGSRRLLTKGDVRIYGLRAFHDHAELDKRVSLLSSEWKRQVSELTAGRSLSFQELSAGWMKDLVATGCDMSALAARLLRLVQILKIDPAKPIGAMSDGMMRRVQIAMKLLRPSKLVLVDEVTADLDVLARQALLRFLREESEAGCAVLYCTHIMDGLDGWATHVLRVRMGGVDSQLVPVDGERMLLKVLRMLEEDAALPEPPRPKEPRSRREDEANLPSGWLKRGATQAGAYGSYSWNADKGSEDTWTFASVAPAPGAPQPARSGLEMMAAGGGQPGVGAPGIFGQPDAGARRFDDNPFGSAPRGNTMGYDQLVAQGIIRPDTSGQR
mmetsp:Transcript_78988/g.229392  ORF Transcript_78988/g.229392 Transcript_78988/m.229392 type:complete len:652 (+) Transcript_78988:57-2012(+)